MAEILDDFPGQFFEFVRQVDPAVVDGDEFQGFLLGFFRLPPIFPGPVWRDDHRALAFELRKSRALGFIFFFIEGGILEWRRVDEGGKRGDELLLGCGSLLPLDRQHLSRAQHSLEDKGWARLPGLVMEPVISLHCKTGGILAGCLISE